MLVLPICQKDYKTGMRTLSVQRSECVEELFVGTDSLTGTLAGGYEEIRPSYTPLTEDRG